MSRFYKFLKKYHKWLGVTLAIFFMLFALSGIVMNHRSFFSKIDIKRSWLPNEYQYTNWNNAAIRGAKQWKADSVLVYGNIGVWLTDTTFSSFTNFNKGFPKGIDNRKIADLHITRNGNIFAATLFGLYRHSNNKWQRVKLPIDENRMVALEERGDSLIIMSRSYAIVANAVDNYQHFEPITLATPTGQEKRISLFKTIWVIHSGKIWGDAGKFIVDLGGLAMIFLSLTGLFYFFAPKLLKSIRQRISLKSRIKRANKWSFKWHLEIGIIASIVLLLAMFTGMFLRPPLLIPIANKTVKPIKWSKLDNSNFWDDNLRDIAYDGQRGFFMLATAEGIYALSPDLKEPPVKFALQPPISVMGINTFWPSKNGFVVGSFSGLFWWNPFEHKLYDYITKQPAKPHSALSSPFGVKPIAGGFRLNENEIFFDYNSGAFSETNAIAFPAMPKHIIDVSGMSLWNLALEVHTWRIIKFMVSDFYILVVPLAGILGIIAVLTGSFMWIIRKRKKKSRIKKMKHLEKVNTP